MQSATGSFQLTINPMIPPLAIASTSPLPPATEGQAYSFTFQATGGTPPYTWSTTDTLPAGLMLSSMGMVSGTPTVSGSFTFSVTVMDSTP